MLGSTSNNIDMEKEIIWSFIARNVDGLIILPSNYYDEAAYYEIAERLKRRKLHFLFANLMFSTIKANYIITDLEEGEYRITKYLLDNKIRDLAFMGGSHQHIDS